jgi:hypothetical protein
MFTTTLSNNESRAWWCTHVIPVMQGSKNRIITVHFGIVIK